MKSPSQLFPLKNADLQKRYDRVKELYDAYPLKTDDAVWTHAARLVKRVYDALEEKPLTKHVEALDLILIELFEFNKLYYPPLLPPLDLLNPDLVALYESDFDADRLSNAVAIVEDLFFLILTRYGPPSPILQSDGAPSIPFIELCPNPAELVAVIVHVLAHRKTERGNAIFPRSKNFLDELILRISGNWGKGLPADTVLPSMLPEDVNLPPTRLVDRYLSLTPFAQFLLAEVPFAIPDRAREEHTMIVAGSGAGKTTLIQQIVLDDLAKPDPPPMVIIDPKGEMVKRIAQLDVFHPDTGRLRNRLVLFDPDAPLPPALNMFAPSDRALSIYDRQDVESELISNFGYIFSTIGNPLTAKQEVPFNFCVRLLFRTPEATILTFMDLLSDQPKFPKDPVRSAEHSPFAPIIAKLDPLSNQFFTREFYATNFNETKDQIRARLCSILSQPRLAAMFSARTRQLDMYACLQGRKIVLVNAALGSPGSESSQLLARYMLSLTLNAAFEQAKFLPRKDWKTAYLICDEFQLFADEFKTPRMLQLAREYKLGVLMAFQQMHGAPFTDNLRTSLSTNTSVKYASSPEGVDIGYVARDLRTSEEFIRAQTKTRTHGRFACFVRGLLENPVALTVPFGNIQREPQMDDAAFAQLRHINAHRLSAPTLSAPKEKPKPILVLPSAPEEPDEPEPPPEDDDEHTRPARKKKP